MTQLKLDQVEQLQERVVNQRPAPNLFLREVKSALDFYGIQIEVSEFVNQVVDHIANTLGNPNDRTRFLLHQWLSNADCRDLAGDNVWNNGTDPLSLERRKIIYDLLSLTEKQRQILDKHFPLPQDTNVGFRVRNHVAWYDESRQASTRYYAESLEAYLRAGGWSQQNIALVRQSSEFVISNLADPKWATDPSSNRAFAGRGLVVGYVQSGKTTLMNLTIANAIDVGYKLIIVLGGLTDLLRRQTQRRFDKEVAGKQVLMLDDDANEASGYRYATDWSSFIEHGAPNPGVSPRNIERATTLRNDYRRPIGNAFPPAWINDPSSCRVVIIKKNKQRLLQLINGIEQGIVPAERMKLSVLVLDDESDQATINTVNPAKTKERKGINKELIRLLNLLPLAQYVGVTATPVANCLTDPSDANDIYPRHFIFPMARPDGYMGILDFHDLDEELVPILDPLPQPKKTLHIRNIQNPRDKDSLELQNALDAFVLTGALKLYRQSTGVYSIRQRHHTLFYSDSTRVEDMRNSKERLERLWEGSSYASTKGLNRLKDLYKTDIWSCSPHCDSIEYFPKSFEDLKPFISQAVQRIDQPFDGHKQVLVVNGERDSAQIDFQVMDIWKIIVGGMKLSRGYTIEGLTVTYFRRKSTNEAALMQMGRWFGYRAGYRDLVRLWISRNEQARPFPVDIYDFFESVCIDEEKLRRKFHEWYEKPNPDGSRVTPIQIRPLISTVDPRLRPVARNQMWNAKLTSMSFSGVRENTVFGKDPTELSINEKLWKDLLSKCTISQVQVRNKTVKYVKNVPHLDIIKLLESLRRPPVPSSTNSEILFRSFLNGPDCRIKKWTILIPQIAKPLGSWSFDSGEQFGEVNRGWRTEFTRLKTIGDKQDRLVAHLLTETPYPPDTNPADVASVPSELTELAASDRAVLILYPIRPQNHKGKPILGFEIVVPDHPTRLGWAVEDPTKDSPIVDKT